jgi:hypothetical protein
MGTTGRQEVVHDGDEDSSLVEVLVTDLPKGFRYQGFDWSIAFDGIKLARNQNNAETDLDTFEIVVRDDRPADHQAQTLLHELIHVVGSVFPPEGQPTEEQVRALAQGLYAILADNPKLRDFIFGQMKV